MRLILISFFLLILTLTVYLTGCGGSGGRSGGGSTLSTPFPFSGNNPPLAVSSLKASPWGSGEVDVFLDIPADTNLYGVKLLRKTGAVPASSHDGTLIFDRHRPEISSGWYMFQDLTAAAGVTYYYNAFSYNSVGLINEIPSAGCNLKTQGFPAGTSQYVTFYCESGQSDVTAGDRICAFDQSGTFCGRVEIPLSGTADGNFRDLICYFDDSATTADEGGNLGEPVSFTINGLPAAATPAVTFEAKGTPGVLKEITLKLQ
ncbi:MAG: hypothetical protein PHW04_14060 [Candidatus Wallbacteria bacterium]|nr:hypothetical protein [Candidatus Wallbacteria bacterium]